MTAPKAVALGALLALAPLAQAQPVVDPFTQAQALLQLAAPGSAGSVTSDASILGTERDLFLEHLSGANTVQVEALGGFLAFSSGASTGNITSTRVLKLRGIQSALERKQRTSGPWPKAKTRLCSRKRSTMEVTRIRSESPGTPGLRQQMPRTTRSISTPAALAA